MDKISGTLGNRSVNWPHETRGPWTLKMHLAVVGGRAECVALEIAPIDTERPVPLTATALRGLPFATFTREAIAEQLEGIDVFERFGSAPVAERARRQRKSVTDARKSHGGRPASYPLEHYAEVARVYEDAHRRGQPPTQAVADHPTWTYAGAGPISRNVAGKWVQLARNKYHLLEPTQRRRAGGVPATRKAKRK